MLRQPNTPKPVIVFSHGNSFPASIYGAMTKLLEARGYTVRAIEKLGHDPAYPVTSNWPHLVKQLADFAKAQAVETKAPIVLVGHSLGGFLSLMCAATHPDLADGALRGVVLLDAPIIGGWRARMVGAAKLSAMIGSFPPGSISAKRKRKWASTEDAYLHFRAKKSFSGWDDEAIRRYAEHGTFEHEGKRQLAFDRAVETAIYNCLPHNLGRLMKSHPPKCPVAFIGGRQSFEVKAVGLGLTKRITDGRMRMVDGSHLFPIENPLVTAAAIDAELISMLM
jgi:pimeloyl-ACP methyl ester carboxylesterase